MTYLLIFSRSCVPDAPCEPDTRRGQRPPKAPGAEAAARVEKKRFTGTDRSGTWKHNRGFLWCGCHAPRSRPHRIGETTRRNASGKLLIPARTALQTGGLSTQRRSQRHVPVDRAGREAPRTGPHGGKPIRRNGVCQGLHTVARLKTATTAWLPCVQARNP